LFFKKLKELLGRGDDRRGGFMRLKIKEVILMKITEELMKRRRFCGGGV